MGCLVFAPPGNSRTYIYIKLFIASCQTSERRRCALARSRLATCKPTDRLATTSEAAGDSRALSRLTFWNQAAIHLEGLRTANRQKLAPHKGVAGKLLIPILPKRESPRRGRIRFQDVSDSPIEPTQ